MIVVTAEPSHGRDWDWHQELNVVVLSPRLDPAGRERALLEVQAEWRRGVVAVIGSGVLEAIV